MASCTGMPTLPEALASRPPSPPPLHPPGLFLPGTGSCQPSAAAAAAAPLLPLPPPQHQAAWVNVYGATQPATAPVGHWAHIQEQQVQGRQWAGGAGQQPGPRAARQALGHSPPSSAAGVCSPGNAGPAQQRLRQGLPGCQAQVVLPSCCRCTVPPRVQQGALQAGLGGGTAQGRGSCQQGGQGLCIGVLHAAAAAAAAARLGLPQGALEGASQGGGDHDTGASAGAPAARGRGRGRGCAPLGGGRGCCCCPGNGLEGCGLPQHQGCGHGCEGKGQAGRGGCCSRGRGSRGSSSSSSSTGGGGAQGIQQCSQPVPEGEDGVSGQGGIPEGAAEEGAAPPGGHAALLCAAATGQVPGWAGGVQGQGELWVVVQAHGVQHGGVDEASWGGCGCPEQQQGGQGPGVRASRGRQGAAAVRAGQQGRQQVCSGRRVRSRASASRGAVEPGCRQQLAGSWQLQARDGAAQQLCIPALRLTGSLLGHAVQGSPQGRGTAAAAAAAGAATGAQQRQVGLLTALCWQDPGLKEGSQVGRQRQLRLANRQASCSCRAGSHWQRHCLHLCRH